MLHLIKMYTIIIYFDKVIFCYKGQLMATYKYYDNFMDKYIVDIEYLIYHLIQSIPFGITHILERSQYKNWEG